jgi:hypothetical protein
LLYSSENWTIKATDARRITESEVKYMRKTTGNTWTDYRTNTETAKGLNTAPSLDNIQEDRRNWLKYINPECLVIDYRE